MKKNLIMKLSLVSITCFSSTFALALMQSQNQTNEVVAINDISDLWGVKINNYINKEYSPYKNTKKIGKYYKVGIMGHRQVIEFGDSIKMYIEKTEEVIPSQSIGLATQTTFEEHYSYTIVNQVTFSRKTTIGISNMIKCAVLLESFASVGASTKTTSEYTFGIEHMNSETLTKDYTISNVLNYSTIPNDKLTFSICRVSCALEFSINKSYTQEQNMFGHWGVLSNTIKNDYKAKYYIADVICFCYNDDTFGDTLMGLYQLNDNIKVY